MKVKPSSYFLIFILIVVGVVIISSTGMPYYESKLLPLIIGGITFVLAAIELWRELHEKDEGGEEKAGEPVSASTAGRVVASVGWVLGAALGVSLFGFLITITLFILAYLKHQGRGWKVSLATGLIMSAFIYGVFQLALGFELYEGLIYNLITD